MSASIRLPGGADLKTGCEFQPAASQDAIKANRERSLAAESRSRIEIPSVAAQPTLLRSLPGERHEARLRPGSPVNAQPARQPPRSPRWSSRPQRAGGPTSSFCRPHRARQACWPSGSSQAIYPVVHAGDVRATRTGPPHGLPRECDPGRPRRVGNSSLARSVEGDADSRTEGRHPRRAVAPRIQMPPASDGRGAKHFFN